MDASLKEITNLVKEVHPESRKKGTIFDFAICYQVRKSLLYVENVDQIELQELKSISHSICNIFLG